MIKLNIIPILLLTPLVANCATLVIGSVQPGGHAKSSTLSQETLTSPGQEYSTSTTLHSSTDTIMLTYDNSSILLEPNSSLQVNPTTRELRLNSGVMTIEARTKVSITLNDFSIPQLPETTVQYTHLPSAIGYDTLIIKPIRGHSSIMKDKRFIVGVEAPKYLIHAGSFTEYTQETNIKNRPKVLKTEQL